MTDDKLNPPGGQAHQGLHVIAPRSQRHVNSETSAVLHDQSEWRAMGTVVSRQLMVQPQQYRSG